MATTERKGGRAPTKGTPDHFEKLLKGSCSNHAFPVKHLYKDYALMKRFLSGGSKKGDQRRKPEPVADDAEEKDGGFSATDGCLMIFGGMTAYDSKRCQKLARCKVYTAGPARPPSSGGLDPQSPLTGQTIRRAFHGWAGTCSWST
jgi:hypothetical protein